MGTQGMRTVELHPGGFVAYVDPSWDDLHTGTRGADGLGGISAAADRKNGSEADFSDWENLLAFVRGRAVREAAQLLGLERTTVHRLLRGYRPRDPRKIMKAWATYKGVEQRPASSWFLRRVRSGLVGGGIGLVRHGRFEYTCPELGARVGELLAVARGHGGGLVAQTLQAPAERLVLAPWPGARGGAA